MATGSGLLSDKKEHQIMIIIKNLDLSLLRQYMRYVSKMDIIKNGDMCKALNDLYQDGVEKGENRYSQLILKLSELGLAELLVKAASDSDYRDSLYMKYNIK